MFNQDGRPRMMIGHVAAGWALLAVAAAGASSPASRPAAEPRGPVVRVAYFVTTDREPIAGYVERFDRVLTEVQRFYRRGMAAAGYGPMTFRLDRDEAARLRVYVVRARGPMRSYGRSASGAVRREVHAALAKAGLDVSREMIVVFQTLLAWRDGKADEIGPYCGGGTHRGGMAWVYDDKLLDPRKLSSKPVRDHTLRKLDVDVSGVRALELIVTDGGDGTHSDWGVWIAPRLVRPEAGRGRKVKPQPEKGERS